MGKKRRSRGEGSIFQRRDGLWVAERTLGHDPVTGKRIKETYYGTTEAQVRDRLLDARRREGKVKEPCLTLDVALGRWLEWAKITVGSTTYDRYEAHVRRWLVPVLGRVLVADLSEVHGQVLVQKMVESAQCPEKALQALRIACTHFKAWRLIETIPTLPRGRQGPRKAIPRTLGLEDVQKFLLSASGDPLEALYCLALDTGARLGELVALEWGDLNWRHWWWHITRSVRERKGHLEVKEPKSRYGRRRVRLSYLSVAALERHRARLRDKGKEEKVIFTDCRGGYLRRSNFHRRSFYPLLERAGLDCRFHDLRHTSASLLLHAGVNIKAISERLGHASTSFTLDTYAHLFPSVEPSGMSAFRDLFRGLY